jgi:hypothetical protein
MSRAAAKRLRDAIGEYRSEDHEQKLRELSTAETSRLELKAEHGEKVRRTMATEGWAIIEDVILREGQVNSLINSVMRGGEAADIAGDLIKFGLATRILNKLNLVVESGEKASEALRKRQETGRKKSERKGRESPR